MGYNSLKLLLKAKMHALTELIPMSKCKNRQNHTLKIAYKPIKRCKDDVVLWIDNRYLIIFIYDNLGDDEKKSYFSIKKWDKSNLEID